MTEIYSHESGASYFYGFGSFIFALLSLSWVAAAAVFKCPPWLVFRPCTCVGILNPAGPDVSCMDLPENIDLKEHFWQGSEYTSGGVQYDRLVILRSGLEKIEYDSFAGFTKFSFIQISDNPKLEYISPGAFNTDWSNARKVDLYSNGLKNAAPYEMDIFDFLRRFRNVGSINLQRNSLSSVPDNAFANLTSLSDLALASNRISKIGDSAFVNLPKLKTLILSGNQLSSIPYGALEPLTSLKRLYLANNLILQLESDNFLNLPSLESLSLYGNRITTIPSRSFAQFPNLIELILSNNSIPEHWLELDGFEGISGAANVYLDNNNITFMAEHRYKAMLDEASRVIVSPSSASEVMVCDQRAHWICDNIEVYVWKLLGFSCANFSGSILCYCRSLELINGVTVEA